MIDLCVCLFQWDKLLERRAPCIHFSCPQFLAQGLVNNEYSVKFRQTGFKVVEAKSPWGCSGESAPVLRKLNYGFSRGQLPGREKTWAVPWRVWCMGFGLRERSEGCHQAELNKQRREGLCGGQCKTAWADIVFLMRSGGKWGKISRISLLDTSSEGLVNLGLVSIGRRKHLRFLHRGVTFSESFSRRSNRARDTKRIEVGNRRGSVRPVGGYGSSTGECE